MTRLVILGAGGHGIVAADAASSCEAWKEVCFLDDAETELAGYAVIGKFDAWQQLVEDNTSFLVAVGDNVAREKLVVLIAGDGGRLATVLHERATISPLGADPEAGWLRRDNVVPSLWLDGQSWRALLRQLWPVHGPG